MRNPAQAIPGKTIIRHTGKLIIDEEKRQHIIKGDWHLFGLNPMPTHQLFNWKYSVTADRDVRTFPHNGKYMGQFKVTIDNGKKKAKLTDVVETVEKLVFTQVKGEREDDATPQAAESASTSDGTNPATSATPLPSRKWSISGKGSNKYGHFELSGYATTEAGCSSEMSLVVDKTYVPFDPTALPDACETHDVKVCCLRGTMKCVQSNEGHAHVQVEGMWSSDRLNLLVDPETLQKDQIISKFRLEHKSGSSYEKFIFPPDKNIKYSGWFELMQIGGQVIRIGENDTSFKLLPNVEGGWNVEGRGRNNYGSFTLTGTLQKDTYLLELYKHFPPRVSSKSKSSSSSAHSLKVTAPLPPPPKFPPLSMDEIVVQEDQEATKEPKGADGISPLYECYMRGSLIHDPTQVQSFKISGEWCAVKAQYEDQRSRSKFEFGLSTGDGFPKDDLNYSGFFNLRSKNGSVKRIREQQIALKFVKNTTHGYNIGGVGLNDFGRFKVIGTFLPMSATSGRVELYKWYTHTYPTPLIAPRPAAPRKPRTTVPKAPRSISGDLPSLTRQPSGRAIKVPNKNFDAHHSTKLTNEMSQCSKLLADAIKADIYRWFHDPIDPVALNIPDYFQIISNPMDFKTIQSKIQQGEITDHSTFYEHMKLVFNNCITYNKPTPNNEYLLKMCREILANFERNYEKFVKNLKVRQEEEALRAERAAMERARNPPKRKPDPRSSAAKRQRIEGGYIDTGFSSSAQAMAQNRQIEELKEMLRIQQEQLMAVQAQAQANEAKMELNSMGMMGGGMGMGGSFSTTPAGGMIATTNYAAATYETERSLSTSEQERLTKAINSLSGSRLNDVLRIIQKDTNMGDDDDDVQMGVDELPNFTQVKLFEMLVKNKGESKPKGRPKGSGRPKGGGASSMGGSLGGGLGGGMGYNPMAVAAVANGGQGDAESQEDQILEFNEFDSSNLEDDVVLNGGGGGLSLGESHGLKTDDDDWNAARDQAKSANQFQTEQERRSEALRTEMEMSGKQRLEDAKAAADKNAAQKKAEEESALLAEQEKAKREKAESEALRDAMRRERDAVEKGAGFDSASAVMPAGGGFSPLSLTGSASPSGSDYGF